MKRLASRGAHYDDEYYDDDEYDDDDDMYRDDCCDEGGEVTYTR